MSNQLSIGSRDNAQNIANRIMDYWGRRGYVVTTRIESLTTTVQGSNDNVDTYSGAVVRSDMINGWPREVYAARKRAALA